MDTDKQSRNGIKNFRKSLLAARIHQYKLVNDLRKITTILDLSKDDEATQKKNPADLMSMIEAHLKAAKDNVVIHEQRFMNNSPSRAEPHE